MHICHCFKSCFLSVGGVEQVIRNIARESLREGHRVTLAVARPPGVSGVETFDNVEERRVPYLFEFFGVPIMPLYYRCLESLNPDIVHSHATFPNISDVAVLYAARHRKPSILHYHYDGSANSLAGKILSGTYNVTINRLTAQKATRVIATSYSYARTSVVLRTVLRKVEVVPNGVSLDVFRPYPADDSIRQKYGLPAGRLVLFVGRLVKYKGTEYLLRAMTMVKGASLVVVGSGPEERNLKNLARELRLTNVRFIGPVPNEELPYLHAISEMFVFPSVTRNENFGIVALEAMACGKPVIASDLDGVNELVPDECRIKVKPRDVDGLASAIDTLLSDVTLRTRKGQAARINAQKYSWDAMTSKILSIYEEVGRRVPSMP
jgi:glycosyltransferase involved in cell wall biosynthesis